MAVPDLSVKFFNSTMIGAPVLSGTVGALVGLLDACLVDGFGAASVTSLVVAGNVATATVSGGHNLAMAGDVGPVIRISGATPAGLNADWRVASVLSATVFTFVVEGISDQTATGTISVKHAPCGWSKAFSGTNKAAYKGGPMSNGHYLQVVDDAAVTTAASGRWAKWRGYESMTDVDNGTGLFPTAAQSATGLQVSKSDASNTTARWWALVGDDQLFYFVTGWALGYSTLASGYAFGKTGSLRPGEAFDTLIAANNETSVSLPGFPGHNNLFSTISAFNSTQAGKFLARSQTQLGTATPCVFLQAPGPCTSMGSGGFSYPYLANNGALISQPGLADSSLIRTGALPGLYYPQHTYPFAHLDTLTGISSIPERTLQCLALAQMAVLAQCLVDITGPWAR